MGNTGKIPDCSLKRRAYKRGGGGGGGGGRVVSVKTMSQPIFLEDVKVWSKKLLIVSAVVSILVLAYILSRINPEIPGIKTWGKHPAASKVQPGLDAGIPCSSQEGRAAIAAAQFCEAIQCRDADALVSMGLKYLPNPPPSSSQFCLPALTLCRYATGDGVPASLSNAFALFFKAAAMGHARGMCFVAAAYHFGQGVPENRFEALRWCGCVYVDTCRHLFVNFCVSPSLLFRYQRSAALGNTLAKSKIGEFGLLDVPALIKSRAMHGIKNFVRRQEKTC
jgi:hypothetical protein